MNCPKCHIPNDPDARFCKNCGAPLATEETAVLPAQKQRQWLRLAIIILK